MSTTEFDDLMNDIMGLDDNDYSEEEETEVEEDYSEEGDEESVEETEIEESEEEEESEDEDEESEETEETEEEEQEDPEPDTKEVQRQSRMNQAFAQMRSENTRYKRMIANAAKAAGMTPEQFEAQMEQSALNMEAKKNNVSPEVLKRMRALEQTNEEYRNGILQQQVRMSLDRVRDEFGLDREGMQEFIQQLVANQIDLRDSSLDPIVIYRGLNYDKLLERQRQESIVRKNKADKHSSKTVGSKGKHISKSKDTVDTMEDLDALFDEYDKK